MSGPTKHMPLPIASGFGLEPGGGSSGGGRPEALTTDPGMEARRADMASSKPEPKDDPEEHEGRPFGVDDPPVAVPEPVAPAAPAPQVTAPAAQVYEGQDEIDALHERFDRMQELITRRLGAATLHARFDALEKYLTSKFGD